jgi:hypothetical protein
LVLSRVTSYTIFSRVGDLNYDILTPDKSQVLDDLCDIFDLTNIVKNPTCFMKAIKLFVTSILLLSSFQALAVMRNVIIIVAAVVIPVSKS